MKYNPDQYEPVEDRIKRFYGDHNDGRIITILRSDANNLDYAVFEAQVFVADILKATGWAQERRDLELKTSKKSGEEYESVNFSAWLENAETSAIGRALANFNYQGSKKKRASREEMEKVQRTQRSYDSSDLLVCPECGKQSIAPSKYKKGYYCYPSLGGCGKNFGADDPRFSKQGQQQKDTLPQPDDKAEQGKMIY